MTVIQYMIKCKCSKYRCISDTYDIAARTDVNNFTRIMKKNIKACAEKEFGKVEWRDKLYINK